MIQPGQKLSEGDSCLSMTQEQFDSIVDYSRDAIRVPYRKLELVYHDSRLCNSLMVDFYATRTLSFPDFKVLCENTFGG